MVGPTASTAIIGVAVVTFLVSDNAATVLVVIVCGRYISKAE